MRSMRAIVVGAIFATLALGAGAPANARPRTEQARQPGVVDSMLQVQPTSGPAGTSIRIKGSDFLYGCSILISFYDAAGGSGLIKVMFPGQSRFKTSASIPPDAASGTGTVLAIQYVSEHGRCDSVGAEASVPFRVTP
jgi:hypothetical protein